MKKPVIAFLFLAISTSLFSQNFPDPILHEGPVIDVAKKTQIVEIFGNEHSTFVYRAEGYQGVLEQLNDQLFVEKSVAVKALLTYEFEGHRLGFPEFYYLDGKLFMVTWATFMKEMVFKACVQQINPITLLPNDAPRLVAELGYPDKSTFDIAFQAFVRGEKLVQTSISENRQMILLTYPSTCFSEKNTRACSGLHISAFDGSFNPLFKKLIVTGLKFPMFPGIQATIDNAGNIFLLCPDDGPNPAENFEKQRKLPSNIYHLFYYSTDNKDSLWKDIQLSGKRMAGIAIAGIHNDAIILAGFYSYTGQHRICGSFWLSVSLSGQIDEKTDELQPSTIASIYSSRMDSSAYSPTIMKLFLHSDGSAVMIAEQRFRLPLSDGAFHYYYNDIFIIEFSSEGLSVWEPVLSKREFSKKSNRKNSCSVFYSGTTLCVLYGDENYRPVLAQINTSNRTTRISLLPCKAESDFIPAIASQNESKKLILAFEKEDAYNFAILDFLK